MRTLLRSLNKEVEQAAHVAGISLRTPVMVPGSPGTGKTSLILNRLHDLAHAPLDRTLPLPPALTSLARELVVTDVWFDTRPEFEPASDAGSLIEAEPEALLEFDLDDYLQGSGELPHPAHYLSRLPASYVTHVPWTPQFDPSTFAKATLARGSHEVVAKLLPHALVAMFSPRERINPAEVLRQFVLHLIGLWRRADPARFARLLALQLRLGRLWAVFRPPRPPGQLMTSSSHPTRGPDLARMTQTPWSSAVSCLVLT
jgi:hypothetical protein